MTLKFFVSVIVVVNIVCCILSASALIPTGGGPNDCIDEAACLDKLGFDAIKTMHHILDDDENGNVDVAESDEFLREELQYENGYERRHKAFHLNDKYISVKELWEAWKKSEVHNWTVEQTIEWLVTCVELPQYVQTFQENAVDGSTLPRLAVNNMHFLTNILGIKDPIHKQKLALKAMDAVLFGSPKHRNYIKDVVLVTSLVIAVGGCWFAFLQHKYSQQHLKKMMKDMDSLQKAEEALGMLQLELDKAKQEQQSVTMEKTKLEQKLLDELASSKKDLDGHRESLLSVEDMSRLKHAEEELKFVRDELRRAEKQLEDNRWFPPSSLQPWLQLTHELELRNYNGKKLAVEAQLLSAKEGCEKLRKKRSSMMGAFRIAHGSSIDDVDSRILQAKAALTEVTQDLRERLHRWRQIEALCGFSIVNNPGLPALQAMLQGSSLNGGPTLRSFRPGNYGSQLDFYACTLSRGSLLSGSQDDLDDIDAASNYGSSVSAVQQLVHTSATMFLASVPPTFSSSSWQSDMARGSPPQRSLHRRESGSQPNLSILTHTNSAPAQHSSNGNLPLNTIKRSRSAGAETLEPMMKATDARSFKNISTDNLKAVVEEDSGLSTTESASFPSSSPNDLEKSVFALGDSPTSEVSESEVIIVCPPIKQPAVLNNIGKSYSQDQSSPPREVPPNQHSNSEPTLDLHGAKKKKTFLRNPLQTAVVDEENSTDSSSTIDEEHKKEKKKKLFLPGFRKVHKKSS